MKSKRYFLTLLGLIVIALIATQSYLTVSTNLKKTPHTDTVAIQSVGNDIVGDGTIHSENEATLHFQIAGKLTYLPFKVGDSVQNGQIIASLDERTIEDNLQSAVKAAQNQQISFDTVNDFNGDRDLSDTGLSISARRQLQTAMNTLDQTQLAVAIQQIAKEQAYLLAPFSGVITAEDVTTPLVNITPTTSFSLADPSSLVFRANISSKDIDFVSVGAPATISVTGSATPIPGTVEKIYPQQTTVNGQNVYQVDVTASTLSQNAKLGQIGSITIKSSGSVQTVLVPTWTIVGHNFIWVLENNKPMIKTVSVGKAHGSQTEIVSGLTPEDKVITNPESIAADTYNAL